MSDRSSFLRNPPAPQDSLVIDLPADYLEFLAAGDGGEGFLGPDTYIALWRRAELAPLNLAYETARWAPGLFIIGSSGSGDAYAFDLHDPARPFVSVPFVGLARRRLRPVAPTFTDFLRAVVRSGTPAPDVRKDTLGLEVWQIHPILLGGDPTAPTNRTTLSREAHVEAVQNWNAVIATMT